MTSKRGLVVATVNLTTPRPLVLCVEHPELLPTLEEALALPATIKVEDLVVVIQFYHVSLLVFLGTDDLRV